MDADTMLAKMRHLRGPGPGEGRGHGRPWRGIVEDVPHIWVTWIVAACKRLGRPVPPALEVDGVRVPLVWVQLTFGRRYYFVAPCCGRRVETLYFLAGKAGCRRCLRLGYESQVYRPGSVWRVLKRALDRRPLHRLFRRWEDGDSPIVKGVVNPLRELMAERIEEMLSKIMVEVEGGEDDRGGEAGPA